MAKTEITGMSKMAKTAIMCLSRHPVQCTFQTNGITLQQTEKFKILGVTLMSDGRQDNKLDTCIAKASAVMWQLYWSVVLTRAVHESIAFCLYINFCSYSHLWS